MPGCIVCAINRPIWDYDYNRGIIMKKSLQRIGL